MPSNLLVETTFIFNSYHSSCNLLFQIINSSKTKFLKCQRFKTQILFGGHNKTKGNMLNILGIKMLVRFIAYYGAEVYGNKWITSFEIQQKCLWLCETIVIIYSLSSHMIQFSDTNTAKKLVHKFFRKNDIKRKLIYSFTKDMRWFFVKLSYWWSGEKL